MFCIILMISCTVHDENTQIQQVEKKPEEEKYHFFWRNRLEFF
jgi:hypothetical protein